MEGDPLIHKNANESLSWCQNLFFSEKRKKAKQNIKKQKEEDIFVNS